ncbi:MAG: GldG family protein, partial [Hyphomonas sp.]|nr:GldG family protein [Hyphomonas sp.]
MRAKHYLIAATALTGIIFVSANLLTQKVFTGARIDFTENNLYTLSDATRTTLKSVSEPVDITFVYTRSTGQDFPAVRAYAARVRELLQVYESQSGGKVRVTEIDPLPFSPAEDEALAAGITAVDTNGNDPLYFGIIGRNSIDDQRVIPFLAPEREVTLEYDLTRMVARLDDPDPPRVGILSSLPGMTAPGGEGGYTLLRDIHKSFDVEPIAETFQSLPEDLDVLLIAQPPLLTARQEWLIDQFILRTGRAVFLVDPAAKTVASTGPFDMNEAETAASLTSLGKAWGVTLSEAAVADAASALPVPVDTGNGRIEELAHPLFLGIPAGDMNQDDLITADLSRAVNFGAPGAVVANDLAEGVELTPLLTTGPSPSYIDAAEAVTDMTPQQVLRQYQTEPAPLVLAARLSGHLATAFPQGAPAFDEPADPMLAEIARAEAAAALPHIAESETDAQIIVIGDVDFIADDFYIIPNEQIVVADNGALVLNALDALAGGGELSRLRSRAPSL